MTPWVAATPARWVLAVSTVALVASACGQGEEPRDTGQQRAQRSLEPVVSADWCERGVTPDPAAAVTSGDDGQDASDTPATSDAFDDLSADFRSHVTVEAPPIADDVGEPAGDAGRVAFRTIEDGDDRVALSAGGFDLRLNVDEAPGGEITDVSVSVPYSRGRVSYSFRPRQPLPWLDADVGSSAESRTVGDAYDLTLGRSSATAWWLRIEPTGLPDVPDRFAGLVDEAWACLRTDAPVPPWNEIVFELVARSLFGPVTATAQLRRDDGPVTSVWIHDATGDIVRNVERYVAPAETAEEAVRAVFALDWPGVELVGLQVREVEPLDDDPGTVEPVIVRTTTAGDAPTCVDYVAFRDGRVGGWVAGDSGTCGFSDVWLEQRREQLARYHELERRAEEATEGNS